MTPNCNKNGCLRAKGHPGACESSLRKYAQSCAMVLVEHWFDRIDAAIARVNRRAK